MTHEEDADPVEDVEVVASEPDDQDTEPRPDDQKLVLARDVFPSQLPIIPISDRPLFPKMTVPMVIDDPPLVKMLIAIAETESRFVGIVLRRPKENGEGPHETAHTSDLYHIGVVAEIFRMAQIESQPAHGTGTLSDRGVYSGITPHHRQGQLHV